MGEFCCHEERLDEASWVCFTLPRDIASGAVIDARPDDGESQGRVDRGVEGEGF